MRKRRGKSALPPEPQFDMAEEMFKRHERLRAEVLAHIAALEKAGDQLAEQIEFARARLVVYQHMTGVKFQSQLLNPFADHWGAMKGLIESIRSEAGRS